MLHVVDRLIGVVFGPLEVLLGRIFNGFIYLILIFGLINGLVGIVLLLVGQMLHVVDRLIGVVFGIVELIFGRIPALNLTAAAFMIYRGNPETANSSCRN